MSSSTYTIALISLVLCLSALNANASCIHIVKDSSSIPRVFDLCAFTDPLTLDYYSVKPHLNSTISFSLSKPITPACNQRSLVWGTFVNHDNNASCANFENRDPTFEYASGSAAPGIVINYPELDIEKGNIQVTLRCNQTAPANSSVDFFVDRWEGATIYVAGYSYYGCPVKAKTGNFLSF